MSAYSFDPDARGVMDAAATSGHPVETLLLLALQAPTVAERLSPTGLFEELLAAATELVALPEDLPRTLDDTLDAAGRRARAHGRTSIGVADLVAAIGESESAAGILMRVMGLGHDALVPLLMDTHPSGAASTERIGHRAFGTPTDVQPYLFIESTKLLRVLGLGITVPLGETGILELSSFESREGGALLAWCARDPTRQLWTPHLTVQDDVGTAFRTTPAWLEGTDWARRGGSALVPNPPTDHIRVELAFPEGPLTGLIPLTISRA